jgi:DNA adenine methylase
MGFGSNAHASQANGHRSTGFRANSNRSGATPAHDWANYPDCLARVIDRLAGVTVEHRPAAEVMARHDGRETLFYVDPPYLPETRSPSGKQDLRWRMYRHEMTRDEHAEMIETLCGLAGMVVLSGYADALYDERLTGWRRLEKPTYADGARPRTEILWINPAAAQACAADLFSPAV